MTKQVIRGPSALMIMGDDAAGDAPEPLDAIGIWVIGRCVDQEELS